MCLDLLWNTGFADNLMQLWLSQWITMESNFFPNNPNNNFRNHMSWRAPMEVSMYLTLVEHKEIIGCFVLNHDVNCWLKTKIVSKGTFMIYRTTSSIRVYITFKIDFNIFIFKSKTISSTQILDRKSTRLNSSH